MQVRALITGLAVVAAAVGGGVAWSAFNTRAAAGRPPQAIMVSAVAAEAQHVPVLLEASGYVSSLNSVDIRPQITNVIARVHVREGQSVRAGDVLFSLDDRADRANLEKAEGQLLRDQASLADLRRQTARSEDLRRRGFISQTASETLQTQLETQQAAIRVSQAALDAARVAHGYNTIRAPLAGRIGAIGIYPGSLVQQGGNPLATVTQLDPIAISFSVPERELPALSAATAAGEVKVTALLADGRGTLDGRLSFVDNAVDSQNGTVRVKAVFANAGHQLWPGAYINVRLRLRELRDALVIPLAAIVNAVDGTHVYTVSTEHTVDRRAVEVLHRFGPLAAVAGIAAGDRVVVEGVQNLRPHVRVREAGSEAREGGEGGAPAPGKNERRGEG